MCAIYSCDKPRAARIKADLAAEIKADLEKAAAVPTAPLEIKNTGACEAADVSPHAGSEVTPPTLDMSPDAADEVTPAPYVTSATTPPLKPSTIGECIFPEERVCTCQMVKKVKKCC